MHNEDTHNEPAHEEATDSKSPGDEIAGGEGVSSGKAAAETPEVHGIVGIRFEPCGKVYCFKSDGMGLKRGERVVVESDLGVSIGRVVVEDYSEQAPEKELKPVLRRVTDEDLQKERDNNDLKKEAFDFCNERIMARGLTMKLLGTDVTLDRRRIIFFFSAETRIDFRELVKDLAAKFRTRIELRQVGVRDAARIAGGIGICGRELCCRRFLTSFEPISIKMAKKQELALNTSKLSGICGRLMCCLGYEYDEKLLKEKARQRAKEKEPSEERTALVEVPVDAETVTFEVAVEPAPQELPSREPLSVEQKPHRRKRRFRGRRKKHRERAEGEKATKEDSAPQQKKVEKKAAADQGERPQEKQQKDEKRSKKPFKKKRRRRMRGKKKE